MLCGTDRPIQKIMLCGADRPIQKIMLWGADRPFQKIMLCGTDRLIQKPQYKAKFEIFLNFRLWFWKKVPLLGGGILWSAFDSG